MSSAWKALSEHYDDEEALCFGLLKGHARSSKHLVFDDFKVILEDVVQHHIGLEFLRNMPLFQDRYVETVITRLFYALRHMHWSSTLTMAQFRKSRFIPMLRHLEECEDINEVGFVRLYCALI